MAWYFPSVVAGRFYWVKCGLAVVLVGSDPGSLVYVGRKEKKAKEKKPASVKEKAEKKPIIKETTKEPVKEEWPKEAIIENKIDEQNAKESFNNWNLELQYEKIEKSIILTNFKL